MDVSDSLMITACSEPTRTSDASARFAPAITPRSPPDATDAGTADTAGGEAATAGAARSVEPASKAAAMVSAAVLLRIRNSSAAQDRRRERNSAAAYWREALDHHIGLVGF